MNENMLDVLLFLFENYWKDELGDHGSRANLQEELEAAGFPQQEVDQAFAWLADLDSSTHGLDQPPSADATRIYTQAEEMRLPTEARGFLMHLEQLGILGPLHREMIIERVMALDYTSAMTLEEVKWVTLMVLSNQPGQENACAWVEEMLYEPAPGLKH